MTHAHRWRISEPNGPTSPGVCACGETRAFRNAGTEGDYSFAYRPEKVAARSKAQAASVAKARAEAREAWPAAQIARALEMRAEGLSYSMIGRELGMSTSAVSNQIRRVRQRGVAA